MQVFGRRSARTSGTVIRIGIAPIVVGLLVVGSAAPGCRLGTRSITPCPLTYSDQELAILKVVPLGTTRNQAIKKLSEAGLHGTFGISKSVYYCDVWNRNKTERWHVNVALLFDQAGRFYKTRPAQSETGVLTAGDSQIDQANINSQHSGPLVESESESARGQKTRRTGITASTADRNPSRHRDQRTPFAATGDSR